MSDAARPPETIRVDSVGVVLCRHQLDDVDRLHDAIEESRDHVRPFMPWADQTREDTAGFVAKAITAWDAGAEFSYLIIELADDEPDRVVGGTGLHNRCGPGATEIGYWLHPAATRRGVVTAVSGALTELALGELGLERVEIHCDEANVRSAAVPRRLGFHLERIEDRPITAPGEHGRGMVWTRYAGDAVH